VGVASSRKIVLNSRWDKQEMPLPFSRVAVAVGELIDLSQYGETARLEDVVRQAMEAVERDARDILAGMN